MKLTKIQRRALEILKTGPVTWSPGEAPSNNAGRVHMRTLRVLKRLGLVTSYGLHEWGTCPVYAACLARQGSEK